MNTQRADSARTRHLDTSLYIADYFSRRGIIVHRMQSVTTNSCYLKFDYGAGYSLRISDHLSTAPFDYRFNLILGLPGDKTRSLNNLCRNLAPSKYPRFYYHDGQLLALLDHIAREIETKQSNPDYQSYLNFCRERFEAQTRSYHTFAARSIQHRFNSETYVSPLLNGSTGFTPTIPLPRVPL